MIRSFSIHHFRGFSNLDIKDLQKVTLLGGKNNSGKTTVLEALFAHMGSGNAEILLRENAWRGLLPLGKLDPKQLTSVALGPCFYNLDLSETIRFQSWDDDRLTRVSTIKAEEPSRIVGPLLHAQDAQQQFFPLMRTSESVNAKIATLEYGEGEKRHKYELWLSMGGGGMQAVVTPPAAVGVPAHFLSERTDQQLTEYADYYSRLRQGGKVDMVVDSLRVLNPLIDRVEILSQGGIPVIHVNVHDLLLPLGLLGNGTIRMVGIMLTMGVASGGCVLIDEIGYGLHYSVLDKVWEMVYEAAELFNVQVVASTHSFEVIAAAHRAALKRKVYDRFGYIRLEARNGKIEPVHVSQDSLQLAIDEGMEVR